MPRRHHDVELTPASRLLERRREMKEMQETLDQQKEEHSIRMNQLSQRRQELSDRESSLKNAFLKFDKFLKVT